MKKKNYLKIISEIESVRKKNNANWMDILRIAFRNDPTESSKVMKSIYQEDKRVTRLAKKLTTK
jgi:hypothetical protein